jgi:diaminohydroxyphosphoribosylaminopyrimidine deaminase/5-amino-6-(5-phosphoribosylamino)uracil reductase
MEAGVSRVVFGAPDPGRESGGGGEALRAGGVEVVGPVFTLEESRRENPAFFYNMEHDATYLALKLAQTLDGKIASGPGLRTTITGPEARLETHRLRAGFDGVMVGSGTVRTDDPLLTVREAVPSKAQPVRIVLDTLCGTSPESKLFEDLPRAPLVFFTGHNAPPEKVDRLLKAGATVHKVEEDRAGLRLEEVLGVLWEEGIRSVFCEGGARLATHLIRGGFAHRLYLFLAPFVLGEGAVPAFYGLDGREAWEGWNPASTPKAFGRDILLTFDKAS